MPNLLSLPPELGAEIASYLKLLDLLRFSWTNKHFKEVCKPHIFNSVALHDSGAGVSFLQRLDVRAHIRSLHVHNSVSAYHGASVKPAEIQIDLLCDLVLRPGKDRLIPIENLVKFITSLNGLRDLYWTTPAHIPRAIYKHVEKIGCRLHMRYAPARDAKYETAVTPPRLHQLLVLFVDESELQDLNEVLDIVSQSPCLQRLCFKAWIPLGYTLSMPSWPAVHSRCTLAELHIHGWGWLEPERVMDYVDMSALRSLRLDGAIDDMLARLALADDLHNLRDLRLSQHQDQDLLLQILQKLSLRTLQVENIELDILATFLRQHAAGLHSLVCTNVVATQEILTLLSACSQLEALTIGFTRCQGAEMSTYQTLGKLPALRKLNLTMQSPRTTGDRTGDHRQAPLITAFLPGLEDDYFMLRDITVDDILTQQIFEAVRDAQAKQCLEELWLEGHVDYEQYGEDLDEHDMDDLTTIKYHVAQPCLCSAVTELGAYRCNLSSRYGQSKKLYAPGVERAENRTRSMTIITLRLLWPDVTPYRLSGLFGSFPITEVSTGEITYSAT